MEEIFLHPGFRFSPRDSELVEFYLKPKILGQELPCKIIQERQVFGANANPWQVFDTERDSWIVSEDESEKVMYVFTHITKKANSAIEKKRSTKEEGSVRENFVKKAGCGTWSGKQGPEQVKDDKDRVIGERRYLVFEINEIGPDFDFNKVRGCYRMHYYTLFGVEQEIVLCRITLDLSKKTPLKLKQAKVDESTNDDKNQKKSKKNTKNINKSTKARKNKKINKSESLVISCETNVNLDSAKGVYRCDIAGQYQDDIVEIVNSTPDNRLCGIEGADDQGLQEEYSTNTRDLIVYTERQGVVEDGDGSQVMVNNCYQDDDIASIWNTLPTPNLDDMIVNDNVIAGYFDETNETRCDSALCGVGDDGLYMSEVLNTMSEIPSTSFDPAVDPHEVDLYFNIEELLKDLNSRGEEPAIFENSRSKLLGKRKVVAEGPQEAKRLCL